MVSDGANDRWNEEEKDSESIEQQLNMGAIILLLIPSFPHETERRDGCSALLLDSIFSLQCSPTRLL